MAYNVLLTGGGIDSTAHTILRYNLLRNLVVIDYGQLACDQEQQAVRNIFNHILLAGVDPEETPTILSLDAKEQFKSLRNANTNSLLFGTGTEGFIRARNLSLVLYAANDIIARIGTNEQIIIELALCKEEMMYSDADINFIQALNQILIMSYGHTLCGLPLIQVSTPFINIPKLDFLKSAVDRLRKFKIYDTDTILKILFEDSFTCWTPVDGKHCGVCYHCQKADKLKTLLSQLI